MGGSPTLALNICCFSDNIPEKFIEEIIKGGISKANEAGVIIAGGHTINDNEPKYGLAVIGEIDPRQLMKLDNAKANQDIILTKPLGNGILVTASKNSNISLSDYPKGISYMLELNKSASETAKKFKIKACTDVTGYGLIGHLKNILNATNISAILNFSYIPMIEGLLKISTKENWSSGALNNEKYFNKNILWNKSLTSSEKMILFDPQTSGGLLFTVDKDISKEFQKKLSENNNLVVKKIGETIKRGNHEIEFV